MDRVEPGNDKVDSQRQTMVSMKPQRHAQVAKLKPVPVPAGVR
jgi:hypothetical protein